MSAFNAVISSIGGSLGNTNSTLSASESTLIYSNTVVKSSDAVIVD